MSLNEENIALFDRYLKEELTAEERVEIEEKLSSDSTFQEQLSLYNRSLDAVETFSIGEAMGNIVDQGYKRKKQAWFIPIAAAASILLIAIPLVYLNFFDSPSNEQLFITYYATYPADQNVRGSGQSNEAMTFYRKNNFVEAIPKFEALLASDSANQRIHMFLGNCYLNIDNGSKAVKHFTASTLGNSKILTQNSQWYLALVYLKQEEKKKAIEQLRFIISGNHLFEQKARTLLNELE